MATTTPRIGLTKPDLTDLVDVGVLNTNFDKIDSNIASTKIQATKPTTANAGDLWWDSDTGTLYVYYTDANSSQWVAATSDPINIGVVANQTERDAQYPTPAQGMRVFRTDLGVTQTYYGLYNVSTNPGGRSYAGWWNVDKAEGLTPVKATSTTYINGTGSVDALGAYTFTGCGYVILDGIFNTYTDFLVVMTVVSTASIPNDVLFQFRKAGATQASGYYGCQVYSQFNGVTGAALARDNATYAYFGSARSTGPVNLTASVNNGLMPGYSMQWIDKYNARSYQGSYFSNAFNYADGFVISCGANISGSIQVFGYNG